MIQRCQNNHKLIPNPNCGYIEEYRCMNIATKHTQDNWGIIHLCDECYIDDCRNRMSYDSAEYRKCV